MGNPKYYLYGTEGCHLCEDAEQLVLQVMSNNEFKHVDIIDDPHLVELYSTSIPVLAHVAANIALYWPFDLQQLQEFIRGTN